MRPWEMHRLTPRELDLFSPVEDDTEVEIDTDRDDGSLEPVVPSSLKEL